jgi:hypothetical protein
MPRMHKTQSEHNESAYLPIADMRADIVDGSFVPRGDIQEAVLLYDGAPTRSVREWRDDLFVAAGAGSFPLLVCQLSAIGYFAKSAPIRASAFSAAACGVIPSRMMSASAAPQTCWASASA